MSCLKKTVADFRCFWLALLLLSVLPLAGFEKSLPKNVTDIRSIKAESWSIAGRNIHFKGSVHIPAKELEIHADEAIVNLDSQDIEAFGNVKVNSWIKVAGAVTPARLAELQDRQDIVIKVEDVTGNIWGEKNIQVTGRALSSSLSCSRVSGSLKTGYFHFKDLNLRFRTIGCRADSAERLPSGVIRAAGAKISGCGYIENANEHYSISADKAEFTPYKEEIYDLQNFNGAQSEYSVSMVNSKVNLYGVPILWLPYFYRPKDDSPGLFHVNFGQNSDWGFFVSASRDFTFTNDPVTSVTVLADYYSDRGFGYGIRGRIENEISRTSLTAYSIHDLDPFEAEDYYRYRLDVPSDRFMFRLSHLTHITPRLDFRAQFNWMSDYYFTNDFFKSIYRSDTQPSTFVALENQFDNFSLSAMFSPRVNSFYTTVEKLPEARIDIPRQELFGTGVYYQGDINAGYLSTKWIDFDRRTRIYDPAYALDDYQSFRFDTTHFLYLPINLNWINFVPRAGIKFIAYSKSSKNRVTPTDLLEMLNASHPQNLFQIPFNRYDGRGGSATRLASELGFELSTKFHNTWNDLRINAMGIDGLRHVIRPYINYTYINVAGDNRDHIYYFDDIDRIDNQNFFRFGLENRLQTRTSEGIRNIFSMENFWDLHLKTADGFGNVDEFGRVGDLGTIISLSPLKNLTISSSLLISLDDHNGEVPEVRRNGHSAGNPGLNCKWLNRWNIGVTYTPVEDVKFKVSYYYNRPYSIRSAYSMGSTLTQIESGGYFDRYYDNHNEELRFSVSMPLTPDRRTFGAASISYDFYDGGISNISFSLMRQFHCIELIAMLAFDRDFDDRDDEWDTSFSVQARMLPFKVPLTENSNELLRIATSRTASTTGPN